ncbi:MAG: S9 family peptidase [Planctomycetaceae bacterium]|nr:S9 family peptidase [Planctomycetaceae bacterium]
MRICYLPAVLTVVLCPAFLNAQPEPPANSAMTERPITVEDLFQFKRVSAPDLSPDGGWVAYAVSEIVDSHQNKSQSRIWLVPTDGSMPPRQLTTGTAKDTHPQWSPDGRWILFESTRSGSSQLWLINPAGGEARQLTRISTDAATAKWSPDGKHIAFVSAVYPEFSLLPFAESDAANKQKLDEIAESPVKARVFKRLFYRHWDSYVEDKRQHLFVCDLSLNASGDLEASVPRDVTPGDRDAYPTSTTFSASQDFCFSPDSSHLIFNAVPATEEAWSTNYDLCRVPVSGGTIEWETLTSGNPAADGLPIFSPDGTKLAYRAQRKAGYEADKWEIMLAECSADGSLISNARSMTAEVDLSFDEIVWCGNDRIIAAAETNASRGLFGLSLNAPNIVERCQSVGSSGSLSISADGSMLICSNSRLTHPADIYRVRMDSSFLRTRVPGENLSHANDDLLAELNMPQPESVTVIGADGDPMQMWILFPPDFDKSKKWPLAFLVHGGPQGAWADGWSYRWNPQVWAAQGYAVAMPNPRGSTGFGQKYTDQISGDWGGRCFTDLLAGLAHLERQDYIDSNRMFSAGASFGGYMMNWFQGNTSKFKTLVTHCGVYNFESMYTTTEELWFDEYEHGGPPWGPNRNSYEKHSPHKFAANFRTPMLIIHNDLDFRVPVSEGQQLFTALQRQGIPSKFINFPDEGHWVNKPANSRFWHNEIFAWIQQYCPSGGR